jgi:hypothetical protein
MMQQELTRAQHKLEFRQREATSHVEGALLKGRKFYDEHQAELNRLALIDAELEGVEIDFYN